MFDMDMKSRVWCVFGRLFSIEYTGSMSYFEEVLGMDPEPEVTARAMLVERDLK
jgi:hypothetical protein